MAGMLIAFEGVDQSGKETQASSCASAFAKRGTRCAFCRFPTMARRLARKSRALCRANASTART